jgi:1-deoxy-D-xylulose-5-phosphate reductoisomerase
LNAADEVAVESFLRGEISFLEIAKIVEETLARVESRAADTVEEVLEIDRHSRQVARGVVDGEKRTIAVTVAASPVVAG